MPSTARGPVSGWGLKNGILIPMTLPPCWTECFATLDSDRKTSTW